MKLCYIWIEDYKGFHNQGFNLSTEYNFDFSIDNSLITKTTNDKYLKNFFGKQILDIKAIIGKNASGKTNILELIQYVVDGANTIINKPFFAIVSHKKTLTIYQYKMPNIRKEFRGNIEAYEGCLPDCDSIFFSNVFDGRRHNFNKSIINISTNDLMNSHFGENVNKNYQKIIQQQIKFLNSKDFKLLEETEVFLYKENHQLRPSKVVLTSPLWSNIINRTKTFDEKYKRFTEKELYLKKFILSFRRKMTDNKSVNSLKYYSAFLVFIDFILNRDILNYSKSKLYSNEDEYLEILNSVFRIIKSDFRIDEIYKFIITEFVNIIDRYWNLFETSRFLVELDSFELHSEEITKDDIGTYANRKVQFTLVYNQRVSFFLTNYLKAISNQNLSYSIDWVGISSGHKAYINLFSNFFSIIEKLNDQTTLICIDEGDLYFHPKWQTEFLYKIVNILPKLLNKRCQIFLTTHSPFLVSDLPKNNLIFVSKNQEDELSVLDNNLIEGETFGGNIGELYLDAFFMNGSLISRFAASKIQSLVDKIRNDEQIDENDNKLISEIGDKLIKVQLQKLLHDKN